MAFKSTGMNWNGTNLPQQISQIGLFQAVNEYESSHVLHKIAQHLS